MSLFGTFARRIDYTNASLAPFDTDGARPDPHATEKKLSRLGQLFRRPALSLVDVVCHLHWLGYTFRLF